MRATSTFSFEVGMSTRAWRALAALRIRVSKSEMGSVCIVVFSALLPAGLHYPGNFPEQRVSAETDAAHLKFSQVPARAAAQAAAVAHADFPLRLLAHLGKLRISRHRFSSNSFRYRPARAAARPAASKVRGLLHRSW